MTSLRCKHITNVCIQSVSHTTLIIYEVTLSSYARRGGTQGEVTYN